MKQLWLDSFKIALILNDTDKLQILVEDIPIFATLQQMQEAKQLIINAKKQIMQLKNKTLIDMKNIKQTMTFMKSTMSQDEHKLDIMQ